MREWKQVRKLLQTQPCVNLEQLRVFLSTPCVPIANLPEWKDEKFP